VRTIPRVNRCKVRRWNGAALHNDAELTAIDVISDPCTTHRHRISAACFYALLIALLALRIPSSASPLS
jgi:hypothetical protein